MLPSWSHGLGSAELLGLRWQDVNFDKGEVAVRQTLVTHNHKVEVAQSAKTDSSRRTIAIDPGTVKALRGFQVQQKADRLAWGELWKAPEDPADPFHGLVFLKEDGSPIHPERLSKWFEQKRKKAGLPAARLHSLRHSHATALLQARVPVRVVSQRLGHKSVTTTLAIYSHVLPGDDAQAALTAAQLLDGTDC